MSAAVDDMLPSTKMTDYLEDFAIIVYDDCWLLLLLVLATLD